MEKSDGIIIIGGGLSGLLLAFLLEKSGRKTIVLEASSRFGGRIQTVKGLHGTPMELGATWFSDMHPHLINLVEELGLQKFPQFSAGMSLFQTKSFEPPQTFYTPATDAPSYRLKGGTQQLSDALKNRLDDDSLYLNQTVTNITEAGNSVMVETARAKIFRGASAVIYVPPQLAANQITFNPILPTALTEVMNSVHTWMAGSIKFTMEYDTPFWREKGYSGMLYSHAGIITEMYDHTNMEGSKFGFTGFLNSGIAHFKPEMRKEYVLRQLVDLFGADAKHSTAYFDKVWNDKYVLSGNPLIS
jgi:monoamine oxidase